ncbi:hypothetical protein BDW75DRAFT_235346 [Aspergillus navahoensis]
MAQAGPITDVTQHLFVALKSRIAQLVVTGSDANERIGGLLALDRLIDFNGVDNSQKTTRFASYLRSALRSALRSNDNVVLVYAARTIGRLAKPGGALTAELVESEIQSALECLQSERRENRRFAAVLVIRELAKRSPTLLDVFVPQIFELIWVALRDPKVVIRETSAEAVIKCFEIIAARDIQVRQQWFSRIHEEARQGLKSNNIEWIHGSLLLLKELLLKGAMFMNENYTNACAIQVVLTNPILASYAPVDFTEIYLHRIMIYLQAQLQRDKERNTAFIAIGKIANAVGGAIAQYLDGIIVYIREELALKARNRAGVKEAPMFECISMLLLAVGQAPGNYMEDLLDLIFAYIVHYIPPIKPTIQEKLLDMLSLILDGAPFRPLGCPESRLPPIPSFAKDFGPQLRFSGHILNEFVRDVAINYVENDNPEIRKASALTCCQLFIHDPIINLNSSHSIPVVSKVIEKLLTVSVGDMDPEIRRTVLWSLDRKFHRHLARLENIRCLFLAVNDEVFSVREAAICIIGRLLNPAYVSPPLRKLLVNLLTGLGFASTALQKDETAQLISLFVLNATKLIRSYVDTIVTTLLPKATDANSGVALTTLRAVGELANVGGGEMKLYLPQLMPIILDALQDLSSHSKRQAALRTLGQLASNSGYVIDPYLEYPPLLAVLINIIKSEQTGSLRKETINEFTPGVHHINEVQSVSDVALVMQGLTPSNEEYCPIVVINTLMQNILRENSLAHHHPPAFLPEITEVIRDFWNAMYQVQATILSLVEAILKSLEGEFKRYLAGLILPMLDTLEKDTTPRRQPSKKIFHAFLVFGTSGEDYMHLIVPSIVRLYDEAQNPQSIRKSAIDCLTKLSRQVSVSEFASLMVHSLSRVVAGNDHFNHYTHLLNKVLKHNQVNHVNYQILVAKLQNGDPLPQDLNPEENHDLNDSTIPDIGQKKMVVNQQHLKNAWDASQKSTSEDWQEWIRRFSVELLKESPSPALLAELFNAAFVSCWTELYDQYEEKLVRSIENALTSPRIPLEILHVLLNLYAAKCHAFAKALHYKELEFEQYQNSGAVEALVTINKQLQQSDAAIGILRKAQAYRDVELKETWFEKFQRWEEALAAYKRREKIDPESFGVTMGKMRCLHALGEWKVLSDLAQEKWNQASLEHRRAIAPLAAAAAWGRGQWELMDLYLGVMKEPSPDRSFFGAILAIHRNQFEEAGIYIEKVRNGLDTELSALLGDVQMLAELEEIIAYRQNVGDPEKQEAMRQTWNKRLLGFQQNIEVWQRMLKVRALVTSPRQNLDMWIKFANLCRKSNRMGLAERSLASLETLVSDRNRTRAVAPSEVTYARLKFNLATGHQREAPQMLKEFTAILTDDLTRFNAIIKSQPDHNGINGINGVNGNADVNHTDIMGLRERIGDVAKFRMLLAKSYLRQGEWQTALQRGDWKPEHVREVLGAYAAATKYNRDSYQAWHSWALANFEVVATIASQASRDGASIGMVPGHIVTEHFIHGGDQEVNAVVTEGLTAMNIDTWLAVTPQLIARINQPNIRVRGAVHRLLAEVGKAHLQALVYPLTVAMKSNVARWSQSATSIMDSMRQHSTRLVEQADLVSHELIRIAVLWHEFWHEGLEEASRLYFGDHNVEGMLATLAPLHEMLDRGAKTLREVSFAQAFGRDLAEAKHFCILYRETEETGNLNQAWDLYYTVFRKISRQLPQLSTLGLKYVSPKVKDCSDLDLAVPETYQSGRPIIRILSFDPIVHVLHSKERLRRMTLRGSDGNSYMYNLKGHEDIRQDERVMQLFGLEYRESRRTLLNIEHQTMLQMAPDYDNLTLMQKVEDLYRTRSLCVMSMVGYILGLGDRHPSNLLLDRITGKVVHIDFGDCFEVAMHKEKYPERVPFRLTRLLTFAMEVSNIEGSYHITCEAVMHVPRGNRDSLMAVLEAGSPRLLKAFETWKCGVFGGVESSVPSKVVLDIFFSCTHPANALETNLIARCRLIFLGPIVETCQGSVGSVERTLGVIVLVEHQWLRALYPGVSVLIRKAPETDIGDSSIKSLADDGAVDIGLERGVERVDIHFSDGYFQSEGLVRVGHLLDHTRLDG